MSSASYVDLEAIVVVEDAIVSTTVVFQVVVVGVQAIDSALFCGDVTETIVVVGAVC